MPPVLLFLVTICHLFSPALMVRWRCNLYMCFFPNRSKVILGYLPSFSFIDFSMSTTPALDTNGCYGRRCLQSHSISCCRCRCPSCPAAATAAAAVATSATATIVTTIACYPLLMLLPHLLHISSRAVVFRLQKDVFVASFQLL